MPQCTKVTHFSPKLSLSTSPSSAFVPTCRFCCLLGCLSLCVPVRRSVETLFSTSHHSLYLARRRLTGAHTHTHTNTLIKVLCLRSFLQLPVTSVCTGQSIPLVNILCPIHCYYYYKITYCNETINGI